MVWLVSRRSGRGTHRRRTAHCTIDHCEDEVDAAASPLVHNWIMWRSALTAVRTDIAMAIFVVHSSSDILWHATHPLGPLLTRVHAWMCLTSNSVPGGTCCRLQVVWSIELQPWARANSSTWGDGGRDVPEPPSQPNQRMQGASYGVHQRRHSCQSTWVEARGVGLRKHPIARSRRLSACGRCRGAIVL